MKTILQRMKRDMFFYVLFFTVMGAWAQTTVTIGGLDTSPTTYSPAVTGVSFSNASRGSGAGSASAGGSLSGNGFNTASPEASYTANKFYTFNITAAATHNVTLTSFTWQTALSGTASGTRFTIKYVNNNGTLTNFGAASQSGTTTNTFTGSVTIAAGTVLKLYLIPSNASAATGTVRFTNGSSFNINAVNAASVPTVNATTQVTNITATGAASGGSVSATGGAALTAKGVVWATTVTPTISNSKTTESLTATVDVSTFTSNITGLTSNTRYYYRAYATNSAGTAYGTTYNFYTLALVPGTPTVNNATTTTLDVAVASGGNNTATTYAIQEAGGLYVQADGSLGADAAWKTATAWNAAKTVTGLTPDTQYTFAVKARNGAETPVETAFSGSASGRTISATAPILTLEYASLNFDSFCINTTTTSYFTFSSENLEGGIIEIKAVNGYSYSLTETGTFTTTLDIEDYDGNATTIYVKFSPTVVQNYNGTIAIDALNANAELAQLAVPVLGSGENNPGTVTTVAVTASTITSVGGILSATATTGGCSAFTEYGFDYATTSAAITAGTATRLQTTDVTGTTFTKQLTGLLPSTVYYYRAYAIDATGTVYATGTAIRSFTTSALSVPVTIAATNVEQTSFTANWNAVNAATGYRLDVSTNPNFGTATYATDLIFSEYVEGSNPGNNRALEIYNGTGAAVNLAGYSVIRGDGGTAVDLTGTLANGATYVLANSQAAANTLAVTDRTVSYAQSTALSFTGERADYTILLRKNGVTIDLIDGLQKDKTLVRNSNVLAPSTSFVASQWTTYTVDDVSNLGSHTMSTAFTPSLLAGYNNLNVNDVTTYQVTGLIPFTTYYYRVRAYSGSNTTANSNVTSVTTKVGELTWAIPSGQTTARWTPATYPDGSATGVDATTNVTINADYNTAANGTFTAGKLTLKNGKKFTVATGTTLTLANTIVNEAGADKFVIEDNGALLQTSGIENTNNITVHKKSNPLFRLDYTMWSSPVKGQNLLGFSPNTAAARFYEYGYASNGTAFVEGYWSVTPGNNTFDAAKGYLIRMPNLDDRAGYNDGDVSFAFDGKFAGVPNNGDVTIALSTQNNRFTAVGNPYPSPISVSKFFDENETKLHLGTGLYLWRKRNGDESSSYATLTKAGYTVNPDDATTITLGDFYQGNDAEAGNWLISQGQGFIVKTAEGLTAPQLKFTNAMRSASPGATQGFFRTAPGTASKLWLNVKAQNGTASQAMVAYMQQGTTGLDYGYDGLRLTDGNTVALYSVAANAKLAIQARPEFNAADVVPMGFTAATAGQYTISLDHAEGVFTQGQAIYLKDNAEGIIRNISDRDYTFTSVAGTFETRFELVYTNSVLGTDNPVLDPDTVIVYKQGNNITVNTGSTLINAVNIFDINGRQLYSKAGVNATETAINNLNVAKQVLIIEIDTVKGKVSKRIVY